MSDQGAGFEIRDRLLGVEDLARLLGVSTATVRALRHRGKLPPAIRVGRHVRWRREIVDGWLRSLEEPGVTAEAPFLLQGRGA